MGNIGTNKFSQSTHHDLHADMLGADVDQLNQLKKGVNGDTRLPLDTQFKQYAV